MQAFDLAIENCVGIYRRAGSPPNPICKLLFRATFSLRDFGTKSSVLSEFFQLGELIEVGDPAISDRAGDNFCERGICEKQPAPLRYAIRLIVEPLGENAG